MLRGKSDSGGRVTRARTARLGRGPHKRSPYSCGLIIVRDILFEGNERRMGMLVNIRMGEGSAELAEEKERGLLARLGELRSVIVALSGGTDSAYLAWAAH